MQYVMKKSFLLVLLSFSLLMSLAKSSPLFFPFENDGFCKLVTIKKDVYCVTKKALYKEEKKGLKRVVTFSSSCNAAACSQDKIWLAMEKGIVLFDSKNGVLTAMLPEDVTGNITHIETDELNNIWFTKEWEGCFKISSQNKIQQIIQVPVTYSLTHTDDSNMWVGTNVGLYKVPVSGKEIVRYAEEGIADNDLPDNLVERLYGTRNSVWAVMPGHISHIVSGEEEAPDFENIGSHDNELYNVAQVPNQKQSFLFATKEGILYFSEVQNNEQFSTGEIHQQIKEKALHLEDNVTEKPTDGKSETVKAIELINEKIYFVTERGYWFISLSSFLKKLKKK